MNYSSLGFKAGVEIHQRIDSKKLFCECYANPSEAEEKIDERECLRVTRFLRPVVGELGVVDPAAAFEAGKKNKFVYLAPRDSSCLVELDDEPPHALNEQALDVALGVVKALNATPLDEVHVMRKTVVDGSAVSGFQRTALVGVNGFIETTRGRVGIQTISLEEESSGNRGTTSWRDRLPFGPPRNSAC